MTTPPPQPPQGYGYGPQSGGANPYAGQPANPYAGPPTGPYGGTPPGAIPPAPNPYGSVPPGSAPPAPNPYGSVPYAGPPHPAPSPGWNAPPAWGQARGLPTTCQACGAGPAIPVTIRGHQGFLVIMRFLRREAVLCRTCGLAVFRDMQSATLWQGWWGVLSLIIAPITLLSNLGPWSALNKLPLQPTAPGPRPPLPLGRPVLRRPVSFLFMIPPLLLVLGIPALIAVGLVADATKKQTSFAVDSCVRTADPRDQDLEQASCSDPDSKTYRVVAPADCGVSDYIADPKYTTTRGTDSYFCLQPLTASE